MGVYIHGLDASERCNGCCMNLSGHCLANKGLYVGRDTLEYNSKPDWCPATNIQPHGRCIDADALFLAMFKCPDGSIIGDYGIDGWPHEARYADIKRFIRQAPTIIPADPERGNDI